VADDEPVLALAFYVNIPWAAGDTRHAGLDRRVPRRERQAASTLRLLFITWLSSFVFALIEGYTYGWTSPSQPFGLFGWSWPLDSISIIRSPSR